MNQIPWDDSFSVGVPEFDHQHKQIIDIINMLLREPDMDTSSEVLSDALQRLMTYSQVHFQAEERFLANCEYPRLNEQHLSHVQFEDRLMEFIESVMMHVPGISQEVLLFLKHWWVDHIMIEDMEYRLYFKNKHKSD